MRWAFRSTKRTLIRAASGPALVSLILDRVLGAPPGEIILTWSSKAFTPARRPVGNIQAPYVTQGYRFAQRGRGCAGFGYIFGRRRIGLDLARVLPLVNEDHEAARLCLRSGDAPRLRCADGDAYCLALQLSLKDIRLRPVGGSPKGQAKCCSVPQETLPLPASHWKSSTLPAVNFTFAIAALLDIKGRHVPPCNPIQSMAINLRQRKAKEFLD